MGTDLFLYKKNININRVQMIILKKLMSIDIIDNFRVCFILLKQLKTNISKWNICMFNISLMVI